MSRQSATVSPSRSRLGLSRERIVGAALSIVDGEGLDALSMRRVAADLGAGTMSLYWYVADRDELVALVADAAFADVELAPEHAPWREQVTRLCEEFRLVVRRHPSLVPAIARGPFGPNHLRLQNRLVASFRHSGLSDPDAASATLAVGALTQGFAYGQAVPIDPSARQSIVLEGHGPLASLPVEQYADLVELADELLEGSDDAHFAFSLGALLDGIEARLARGGPAR